MSKILYGFLVLSLSTTPSFAKGNRKKDSDKERKNEQSNEKIEESKNKIGRKNYRRN